MKPLRLTGIGLRPAHEQTFLRQKPPVAWIEVHSENYFIDGGRPLATLDQLRADYPISLHGVGLSIGSTDALNWQHLKKLRELIRRVKPALVSEHLAWTSFNGQYFHDLLPLPYNDESLTHLAERIMQVQEYLSCTLVIENITRYVDFKTSTYTEWEFLNTLCVRTGCQLLLDINNLYVNAQNIGCDAAAFLHNIQPQHIVEYHLAGFTESKNDAGETILIDSHSRKIAAPVWTLFQTAIATIGRKPTIIEWDCQLPDLSVLIDEAKQAEELMRETYATEYTS